MLRFVIRQLRYRPLRSAWRVLCLSAVVAILLLLRGFGTGLYRQMAAVALARGGDLIVAEKGTRNMVGARSSLSQLARGKLEALPEVAQAWPMAFFPVIYTSRGLKSPIFLVVFDGLGGPPAYRDQPGLFADRGVVIDRSLALKFGLKPGDAFRIFDSDTQVRAVSRGSAAMFTPFAFISYDTLLDILFESNRSADFSTFPMVSFLLVQLRAGAGLPGARSRIAAALPEAEVLLPGEVAEADFRLGRQMFGPVVGIMVAVAHGLGVLVVALLAYAEVSSRRREFGVLKALGFPAGALFRAVFLEVLLLTAAALPLGAAAAWLLSRAIEVLAPVFSVPALEAGPLASTALASLLMACLGALSALKSLGSIEPASAFQGSS